MSRGPRLLDRKRRTILILTSLMLSSNNIFRNRYDPQELAAAVQV